LDLPFGIAFGDFFASIVLAFPTGEGEFQFGHTVPEVQFEGNQRVAFLLCFSEEALDLVAVQ